jgi:hypothetical protein
MAFGTSHSQRQRNHRRKAQLELALANYKKDGPDNLAKELLKLLNQEEKNSLRQALQLQPERLPDEQQVLQKAAVASHLAETLKSSPATSTAQALSAACVEVIGSRKKYNKLFGVSISRKRWNPKAGKKCGRKSKINDPAIIEKNESIFNAELNDHFSVPTNSWQNCSDEKFQS